MSTALDISLAVSCLSMAASLWLAVGRSACWRTGPRLDLDAQYGVGAWPLVAVIVPARTEADMLPETLPMLLAQRYPSEFHIYLVNDQSVDGTGELAAGLAQGSGAETRLSVVGGQALPGGWAEKVWAREQGVRASSHRAPDYLWFTYADIAHAPGVLAALVSKAVTSGSAMVSVMADLRKEGFWERLLVPAFVFYFAKLYPFRWVNDPARSTAAAAGGCVLLDRTSLESAGDLAKIADAIIEDCALARLIKTGGPAQPNQIWLGLCHGVRSVRRYQSLSGVWSMVARTAYTQLEYSPLLLAGTVISMGLVYLVPPAAALGGIAAAVFTGETVLSGLLVGVGWAAWVLLSGGYQPVLRWYRASSFWGPLLPLAGLLYTVMTVDPARRHWRGKSGAWKGRTFSPSVSGNTSGNLPGSRDRPNL